MSDKQPPIHAIRIGNIKASIWENQSRTGKKFCTTTIVRSYRDEHEQWHESTIFYADDLPKIELATRKAFEFIHMRATDRQHSLQEQHDPNENNETAKALSQPGQSDVDKNGTHVEKLATARGGRKR